MPGHFVPDPVGQKKVLTGTGGPVWLFVSNFSRAVEKSARAKALKDTGEMAGSIHASAPNVGAAGISLTIRALSDHAMVIHQGHKVIRPKKGKYLKFQPRDMRGTGKYVYTTKVRAVGGVPFLTAALNEVNNALPGPDRFKIVIKNKPRRDPPPRGASLTP